VKGLSKRLLEVEGGWRKSHQVNCSDKNVIPGCQEIICNTSRLVEVEVENLYSVSGD
jgi:hypothetical protein